MTLASFSDKPVRKGTGATVLMFEADDGWRIQINFDDGCAVVSSQAFATKSEADAAFRQWAEGIGAKVETAQ